MAATWLKIRLVVNFMRLKIGHWRAANRFLKDSACEQLLREFHRIIQSIAVAVQFTEQAGAEPELVEHLCSRFRIQRW